MGGNFKIFHDFFPSIEISLAFIPFYHDETNENPAAIDFLYFIAGFM
jgi:hypothetical protein